MKISSSSLILTFILPALTCISCSYSEAPDGYFIDGIKGNDKNSGTSARPVKSITRLNELIEVRLKSVYLTGGQVYEGTLVISGKAAGPDDPVSISSTGEGRAVINGGNGEAVRIINSRNIRISNIDIRGSGRKTGNTTNGLALVGSEGLFIEYIRASGFQKSGIDLYDCRNCRISRVVAEDNGFCGINVMGSSPGRSSRILIKDCMAENNAGDPTMLDNHSGNGILVGVSDSVIIDHCTATNNGWDMPRLGNGPVGIWAWQSSHVIIQYCISYRNRTSPGAKDGGGFDLDGGVTNSIIQYCLSYDNEGAGYGLFQYPGASNWSDNIIRYCISYNDAHTTVGAGSIFIWNGSDERKQLSGCLIHNNVIYNTKAPVVSFEDASLHQDFIFCNNIFVSDSSFFSGTNSGSKFIANAWWNNRGAVDFAGYSDLSSWAAATGQEMHMGRIAGFEGNPRFSGSLFPRITDPYLLNNLKGYILKPESPLKDKGLDISSLSKIYQPVPDFFGNPVPEGKGTEPGIYEMN